MFLSIEIVKSRFYAAADNLAHSVDYLLGAFFHVAAYPIEKHAHERVFIKVGDVFFRVVAHGVIFGFFVYYVFQKRINEAIKVLFEDFERNRTVNIVDERFVLFRKFEHG